MARERERGVGKSVLVEWHDDDDDYFNGRRHPETYSMLLPSESVQYSTKSFQFNEWDKYKNHKSFFIVFWGGLHFQKSHIDLTLTRVKF